MRLMELYGHYAQGARYQGKEGITVSKLEEGHVHRKVAQNIQYLHVRSRELAVSR